MADFPRPPTQTSPLVDVEGVKRFHAQWDQWFIKVSQFITATGAFGGVLPVAGGGTGISSYAAGDLLYASTTTSLARLADVATGNALLSGGVGVAPAWGKVGLTTHVSGILPVANGGTGVATAPANGQVDIGNGTGFARTTLTAGPGATITNGAGTITIGATGTGGTVTSVSVVSANGVSGSVATATTTPAITLVLGAITPTSVAAVGAVTGSNLSGTNTGDQTSVSGNAGTATSLATARAINGVNFDGTTAITVTAAAGTLTGATLNSGVTASSLTSVGTLASLKVTGDLLVGEASAGYSSAGRGLVEVNGSSSALVGLRVGTTNKGYVFHTGTDLFVSNDANGAFIVNTNATEEFRVAANGTITAAKGFAPDAGGLKHARITTGSVAAGSTTLVTCTWSTAFADANYTVTTSVIDSTTSSLSLSIVHVESVTASAVTVRVLNNAIGALTGTLQVIAIHD